MDETITIRPLRVEDASVMTHVLSSPSLYHYIGGEPATREELERRYTAQVVGHSPDGSERWINYLVMLDEHPVGYVQATVPVDGKAAEISWVIGQPWQGRGFAKQAARLLLDDLFDAGVSEVVAFIHPDHLASQRVARFLGMHETSAVVEGENRWLKNC
ncbi:GNAT family N-acetyltransferase [Citricoccus muralis]|uniref:GNAT family N-acetyltransferase n=1 Tax=Citricoccus muralis TaxID=169134 RepID=A0ABY8H3P7_9MICC|nr:GNAT family N-acetyltransferase [Citricoccus muralis]WFP15744.1 GNAT family N-acetyltransferase [Citricoccus muralis]